MQSQIPSLTFFVNLGKWINIANQNEEADGLNMERWGWLDITKNVSFIKCPIRFNDSGEQNLGLRFIQNMHFPFKIIWYAMKVFKKIWR